MEQEVARWEESVALFEQFLKDRSRERELKGPMLVRVFFSERASFHDLKSVEEQLRDNDLYQGGSCNESEFYLAPDTTLYELYLFLAEKYPVLMEESKIAVVSLMYFQSSGSLCQNLIGRIGPLTNEREFLLKALSPNASLSKLGFKSGNFLNIALAGSDTEADAVEKSANANHK